jgi:hypothetical protein
MAPYINDLEAILDQATQEELDTALDEYGYRPELLAEPSSDPTTAARQRAFQRGFRLGLDDDYAVAFKEMGMTIDALDNAEIVTNGLTAAQSITNKRRGGAAKRPATLITISVAALGDLDGPTPTFDEDERDLINVLIDDEADDEDFEDDDDEDFEDVAEYRPVALVAEVDTNDAAAALNGLRQVSDAIKETIGDYEVGELNVDGDSITIELIPQANVKAPITGFVPGELVATMTATPTRNTALVYNIRVAGENPEAAPEPAFDADAPEVTHLTLTISNVDGIVLTNDGAAEALRLALLNLAAVLGAVTVENTNADQPHRRVYSLRLDGNGVMDARILRSRCVFDAKHTFPGIGKLRAVASLVD